MGIAQIIRQYEKEQNQGRVPIIAMADSPMTHGTKKLYRENTDACLTKSLTPERLLQTIERWTWQNEAFLRAHVDGYSRMKSRKNQGRVFNLKAALDRAMDDKEFLEMLVNEFVDSLPGKIDAVRDAVLKEDRGALILTAQSLKGSSANMGADMINAAARAIEKMGEKGDLGLAENRIKQLENESDRFKEHVIHIKWSEV